MTFRTIDDLDVSGKRCLVRVDLNVPMADGKVSDTTRIERIKPTINELSQKGAKVILVAHFGRPKGQVEPSMSLAPIVSTLSEVLDIDVGFSDDTIGDLANNYVSEMHNGDVLLLENVRFYAGEETNDAAFAAELVKLGDIYINDAFSAAHRAHASTEGLAKLLPSAAGRTMQAELEALNAALGAPKHPVVAVVGGAKVSTKLDLLMNLVSKVDTLVIGGGMANTFLAAQGVAVGKSLCEHYLADTARNILVEAEKQNCKILLPIDCVVASEFKANAPSTITTLEDIPQDGMILDAGPNTVEEINAVFDQSKTLIWNGPLGAFEIEPFDRATVETAQHAAKLTKRGNLVSVAGGGDTVAAMKHAGVADELTYISTAGGAFLEWMEGKELPGVKALG